jgi:hypothetical protein
MKMFICTLVVQKLIKEKNKDFARGLFLETLEPSYSDVKVKELKISKRKKLNGRKS